MFICICISAEPDDVPIYTNKNKWVFHVYANRACEKKCQKRINGTDRAPSGCHFELVSIEFRKSSTFQNAKIIKTNVFTQRAFAFLLNSY